MSHSPQPLLRDLAFGSLLPDARFSERHSIVVDQPIERAWKALDALTGDEIKLLRPLFQLRGLPAKARRVVPPAPVGERRVLELFADEGFVMLRHDAQPVDGHAVLIFGAAGRFWSPAHNAPVRFDSPANFVDFDEPGYAKTVARFEMWDEGGHTRVETETLVAGTDRASSAKFGAYWTIIRGPSGLLRRSWLAAIDRRANQ